MDEVNSTPPPQSEAESRSGLWLALGLVAVTVLVILAGQAFQQRPPGGPDSAASRDHLNRVQLDTFTFLDLEPETVTPGRGPVACDRPGGGVGDAYYLDQLKGPALEDLDGQLEKAGEMLEGLGMPVSIRRLDPGRVLSAQSPDGGGFYLASGPEGTIVEGESACGAPTEPSAD